MDNYPKKKVAHGNAAWGPATTPGFGPEQGMPGARLVVPVTAPRPLRPPAQFPQADGATKSGQRDLNVPVLEDSFLNENGPDQANSKLQEATAAEKKVKEKIILDSKEKLEFYRTKMQDLVLYKSRCDNKLNEITERAIADKRETKHGDTYDCVDINKQPSLQHPALRGHKVQISPPQEVKQAIERLLVREKHQPDGATTSKVKVGLKQGCPFGSIPIRRLAGQNSTMPSETYNQPLDDTSRGGSQFAGLLINGNQVYRGAQSYLCLYNPKVGSDQSSSSIIALISKDGNTFNRIEAGWTV